MLLVLIGCGGGSSSSKIELLEINSAPVVNGYIGEKYIYDMNITGSNDIRVQKPDWMVLNNSTLSGYPDKVGNYDIEILVVTEDQNITQKYVLEILNNSDNLDEFKNDFVFLPSYEIGYKANILPIEFIVPNYNDIKDFTIMFTRSIDGLTYDYEFGTLLFDITHNIGVITADIVIPENISNEVLNTTITAYYLDGNKQHLIHAVNISQSPFIPEIVEYRISVDMTDANSGYELVQDNDGVVHITQTVSGLASDCEDSGWTWNNNIMKCIPPEDSPTYEEILLCISNENMPNKWDFVTGTCYAEIYPDMEESEACELIGAVWDYTIDDGKCVAPFQGLSNQEACSQLSGLWNFDTNLCETSLTILTNQEACEQLLGSWDYASTKCFTNVTIVTNIEACEQLSGSWNFDTDLCYTDSEELTDKEACSQIHGLWDFNADSCFMNQSDAQACYQLGGVWDGTCTLP